MQIKEVLEVLNSILSEEIEIEDRNTGGFDDSFGEVTFLAEKYRFSFQVEDGEIQYTNSVIKFFDLNRKDITDSIFDFTDENDPVALLKHEELVSLEYLIKG